MSEQVVASCSIESLDELKKENESGMLLFVSQKGCHGCEEMRTLLTEVVKGKLPIVEAGVEDESCLNVAEQLHITITPTIIYYKLGVETKRISVDGVKTPDDFRKEFRELVEQSASAPAV